MVKFTKLFYTSAEYWQRIEPISASETLCWWKPQEKQLLLYLQCVRKREGLKNILYYPVCLGILLLNAIKKGLVL